MSILALDIFCGAGGVTHGLRKAGIKVAVGVDKNEDCRLSFTQNNPSVTFLSEDVSHLNASALLSHIRSASKGDLLLLAACAPCQPFSSQNKHRDKAFDRAVLRHVERLVKEMRPDFLFIENVPGLQKVSGYSAFRRLRSTLRRLRYKTKCEVVDACSYGVPQHRKRLVLTASLHGESPWPVQSHGEVAGLAPFKTVREAISKYPRLSAGEEHPTVPNHIAAQLADHNVKRLKATPLDGGSRQEWPSKFVLECHKKHDGHPDVYGRLRWDAPAPTLTTKCTSLSNGRYGHPEQDRAISAREAAALQGFDDTYMFHGGIRQITRQIGNAVPPALAERFGLAFVEHAGKLNGSRTRLPWQSIISKPSDPGLLTGRSNSRTIRGKDSSSAKRYHART